MITNYNVSFLLHSHCSSFQFLAHCFAPALCIVGVLHETFATASFAFENSGMMTSFILGSAILVHSLDCYQNAILDV